MLSTMRNDHINKSKTCKTAKQMWEALGNRSWMTSVYAA